MTIKEIQDYITSHYRYLGIKNIRNIDNIIYNADGSIRELCFSHRRRRFYFWPKHLILGQF